MKYVFGAAMALAVVAALVKGHPTLAQQRSTVSIQATSNLDLRTWEPFVVQRERAGELRVRSSVRDPFLPIRIVERLQQYHDGVLIWGAEVVRDMDRGVPQSIFGEVSLNLELSTEPALNPEDARATFVTLTGGDGALLSAPALVIVAPESGDHRLAYTAIVSGSGAVNRVFLDANTGAEVLRYSELQFQSAVGTGVGVTGDTKKVSATLQAGAYVADDTLRPPRLRTFDVRGNFVRLRAIVESAALLSSAEVALDSDNDWGDPAAVDAHTHIGWTYDFYYKRLGRRGLDNVDRPIASLINGVTQLAGLSLPTPFLDYVLNAFWCSVCDAGRGLMFFGNGVPPQYSFGGKTWGQLAGALDITAHELTHAVTDATSQLIYFGESGALNEAFSDIMGTSVEFFYQPAGNGIRQADYLIGEDVIRGVAAGLPHGLRSMANPQAFGDFDHYSRRYLGLEDQGGVHSNSGIANNAFYLAIESGTNRTSGLTVQGVGAANREQIEKVFYRAFSFLLPSSATFSTARAATIQAARDLYGSGSAAERAVTQAWTAVGVF